MNVSVYHKVLRVSALTVALMLVFESGMCSPVSKQFADNTIIMLASASTQVGIMNFSSNLNVAATLTARQNVIDTTNGNLSERSAPTRISVETESGYPTYVLSTILFLLVLLILMNYLFDWRRAHVYVTSRSGTRRDARH